jgi:hypothetical protein
MMINCICTTTHRTRICFQIIILYGYNFVNYYDSNILWLCSLYRTFCHPMTNVLCMTSSTYTMVTSGHIILYGYNFVNYYDSNILWMCSLYRTFCHPMNHVLCMTSSTYTTVTSGHNIIFMLSANTSPFWCHNLGCNC